ncbi:MAG: nucleotide exchange factor GrpE [Acidobacteriota bacterium]|jgi:molecular chaperone GrpE
MEISNEEKEGMGRGSERPAGAENTEHERLKAELSREHDLYLRTLADFDNYRRRVERERAVSAQAGKRELILPLLEVLADFDRALEHLGDVPEWMSSGFVAIYRRLISILQAQGIVSYESLGDTFDPARHEAVGMTESQDVEPGTIVAELSRGYRWGDEVLRPARVRVAQ